MMKTFIKQRPVAQNQSLGCLRRFRAAGRYTRYTMVMFPCAGAGAGFMRPLSLLLPITIEVWVVQLPGREDRLSEAPWTSMADVFPEIEAAILQLRDDSPLVFFGHSMGSLMAYEMAHLLWSRRPIRRLIVSGHGAPSSPAVGNRCHHTASDAQLISSMEMLGGTPKEILDSSVLMASYLPTLRADYQILDDYQPLSGARLPCAIDAYAGDDDPEVSADGLLAWQQHTEQPLKHVWFKGGHFYFHNNVRPLVNALSQNF